MEGNSSIVKGSEALASLGAYSNVTVESYGGIPSEDDCGWDEMRL
jgi:hypothetical protein